MDHDAHRDSATPLSSPLDGRYRMLSSLGSGGMADVYLARDESLGRLVAVKVLKERLAADHEFVERFRIEAQAAASLNHPSIVAVYDRGRAGESPYIVMEYVEGESLKQRVRREGRLAPDDAAAMALAVLNALRVAHEAHIVHRDITPANVLIDKDGRVKVTDFGIARMPDSALTRSGAMLGTSSYLSPEQAQGKPADERSDLYSLGIVLYQMLTGLLPFRGDSDVAVALQHVQTAPPNPRSVADGVPEEYAAVVMRALCKHPDDRFQSAAEFADALRAARATGARRRIVSAGGTGTDAAEAGAAAAAREAATGVAHEPAAPPPANAARRATTAGGSTPAPASADPGTAVPWTTVRPPAAPSAESKATVFAADARTRQMAAASAGGEPASAPRRRRRPLRWIALILVLAAAGAAGWAVYTYVLNGGITVPAVVGADAGEAAASLRREGFTTSLHSVWSDRYDAGIVARQRPRQGTEVEDGVKVDLWVSQGPLHIAAPTLSGLSAKEAKAKLEQAVLTPRKRRSATASAPRGEVYRQEPAAGATVTRGDTVTYWVSSGPPMVTVPDVVGLSSGDAKAALEGEGFVVSVDYVAGWGTYPGDVTEQDPVAGERLRKGDEVVIKVAVF
jgi:beta-lactam-binding protein with PASTA domain